MLYVYNVFQSVNPCEMFEPKQREGSNTLWRGDLILLERLNFEEQNSYDVYIRAYVRFHLLRPS